MHDAERAQTKAISGTQPAGNDRWARKAPRFARAHDRIPQPDAFMRFVLPHLQASDTVLDIGAGAGRHALFLAERGAQVIAVEPSEGMRRQLQAWLADALDARLTVLPVSWPEVTPRCDVAISAHVLYGVREVGPFLAAMDAAARRACFVLLGMRQPSFALAPFWERLYGAARHPLPGALECLNVLHQLSIPAHLALVPASRYAFADRQEALEDLRWRLSLPDDTPNERLLAAMNDLMEEDGDGRLTPRHQPEHVAVLWWTRGEAS